MMARFKSWEGMLALLFLITFAGNVALAPEFLTIQNQINLFQLSIEKIIVALVMTLIIINAEIDLSVASVMGLSACAFGYMFTNGWPAGVAMLVCLGIGLVAGMINALLIARAGIPSLVVTLAIGVGVLPTLLSTRLLVYGGQISFSLYMIHEPVHTAWNWAVAQYMIVMPKPVAKLAVVGLIFAAIIAAMVLYHVVEEPSRRWMRRMIDFRDTGEDRKARPPSTASALDSRSVSPPMRAG
jgi:ribose/xylose/arabinose/galactoside ABC-type transport system permease subunit